MDALTAGIFVATAFVGGLVSGLAGFAMGLLLSAVWLHFLTPLQTVTLIIGFGVWTQAYAIWRLRRSLGWRNVAPFILGGALGVPLGAMLLAHIPPAYLRSGIGLLVVLYSVYGFAQPRFRPLDVGMPADVGVGFLNGLVAGLAGLTGIVITIWCQWRGWPKDVQRAVFQPVNLAAVLMTAAALVVAGAVTAQTAKLYALGLPFVLAGFWTGFRLYGRVSDVGFRKLVLSLLFLAGISLLAT
jgi:uncharacterized membrane protein YfcA